tara:strand:+ start:305 stop:943 length:639 start_codon:yes stop_codon:yes gene_type:complete
VLLGCNVWIILSSRSRLHSRLKDLPQRDVALVLGTSKSLGPGHTNLYFTYRIEAAAALYKAGKVKHLLLSGANREGGENEPLEMKKDLMKRGIPEHAMTLDGAGFRTLDSVIRSKKIFGLSSYTIVSQPFHNVRAVFLARAYQIDAIAFNAREVPWRLDASSKVRDYFARVKAVLDLYILNKAPTFLGTPRPIKLHTGPRQTESNTKKDAKP